MTTTAFTRTQPLQLRVVLCIGLLARILNQRMSLVPNNRLKFWMCYAGGTFGPLLASFVMTQTALPRDKNGALLLLWVAMIFALASLVGCVWSVRSILLGGSRNSQQPAWLYQAFGWLALLESLFWAFGVLRII